MTNSLQGAFDLLPSSAINAALGGVRLNGMENIMDTFSDPASLSQFTRPGVAFGWARRFQINNLRHNSIALNIPGRKIGFGLGGSVFGNQIYRESLFSVMCGTTIHNALSIGINLNYYQLQIKNYGIANTAGLSLSWRYRVTPDLIWATAISNFNAPAIGHPREKLAQIVSTGIILGFGKRIRTQLEWEQDTEFEGRVKFGTFFTIRPGLKIACGFASIPTQFGASILLSIRRINVEYAAVYFEEINRYNQQMGLSVYFGRR